MNKAIPSFIHSQMTYAKPKIPIEKSWRSAHSYVFSHLVPPVCSTALTVFPFPWLLGGKALSHAPPVIRMGTAAEMLSRKSMLAPSSCHATCAREQETLLCSWRIIPCGLAVESTAAILVHSPLYQAGEGLKEGAELSICQKLFSVSGQSCSAACGLTVPTDKGCLDHCSEALLTLPAKAPRGNWFSSRHI